MVRIVAGTDGSCWNTKKDAPLARIGGFGAVLSISSDDSLTWKQTSQGQYIETTSTRMEIRGVMCVLKFSPAGSHITIYCDNEHVCNMCNDYRMKSGKRKYLSKIKNSDLWMEMYHLMKEHRRNHSKIKVIWIRGHSGNPLNEKAHILANKGRLEGIDRIQCKKVKSN